MEQVSTSKINQELPFYALGWITRNPCWATPWQSVAPQTSVYIYCTEHTELFPIFAVRWCSQLGVLLFYSFSQEYLIWVLACLHNTAKASGVLDFLYAGLLKDLKTRNRFFVCLEFFLLNSKYPLLSEEGWSSIRNQQAVRGKMPHVAYLTDTCAHGSHGLCYREECSAGNDRSSGSGREHSQLWTQTHRIQGEVWFIEAGCNIRKKKIVLPHTSHHLPVAVGTEESSISPEVMREISNTCSGKHFSLTIRAFKAKSNKNLQFSKLLIFLLISQKRRLMCW